MKDTAKVAESVVIECDLPDPPEKVWRALTEPELLAQWIMPNDMTPEVGARFQFRPEKKEGERADIECAEVECANVECEVLESRPNRTLRWRQTERDDSDAALPPVESVVTFELSEIPGGGTHLRVVHDQFEAAAESSEPQASAIVVQLKPRCVDASAGRKKISAITCTRNRFNWAA
jgi:uncharacterized protein YndB with AHSA1/START domain